MLNRFFSAVLLSLCLVVACNRDPNVAKRKYVESGNKYFDRGKYKEARIMYQNALKRDARYGEAYYRAALADLKLQRYADAVRSLQRAVELQPENLDALNRLSNVYLNVHLAENQRSKNVLNELNALAAKYKERFPDSYERARLQGYLALFNKDLPGALGHFERANRIKPYQQDLVLVYMQTLIGSDRAKEGEKLAQEMLAKEPGALAVYDALFLHYARTNRTAEAEQILKTKVAKNPKNPSAYLQLATYYRATNQRPAMLEQLKYLESHPADFPNAPRLIGDFYLRIREYDQALVQYQAGVQRDPKDKHVYQKLMVEVLVRQGKTQEAQQLVNAVLKENPKDDDAIALRASLSLLGGTKDQLQSAINDLQSVLSRMPNNHVVRYNLGRALLANSDPKGARVQFEEAIKAQPDYLPARIGLAQVLLQSGDSNRTVQVTQEILARDPRNVAARLLRSRALIRLGQRDQARNELLQASQQYPDLAEAKLQLASLDMEEGKHKAAEETFRAMYSKSQDPRAFMGLVQSHVAQGQPEPAIKMLRDELAKNPERVEYRVALANISVVTKDYPTAVEEYKKVLEKLPRAADVWLRLGETYRRSGDMGSALSSFQKAREIAPNNVPAMLQLALIYDTAGQRGDAKSLYEQILRVQPDNFVALNNLAFILADAGSDLDQALTMAQRAKQQAPKDHRVSDTLGLIYTKKNLADSAIGIFRDLVAEQPAIPGYRYHFAMALLQKGDKASAKKECEAALRANPSKDEEAKIRELLSKLG
jgi:tetratricopeptide (TPR) repeat protein